MRRNFSISAAAGSMLALLSPASVAQPGAASPDRTDDGIALSDMIPGSYTETVKVVSVSGSVPRELKQAMRNKSIASTPFCYLPDPAAARRLSIVEQQTGKDCRPVAGTVTGENATVRFACQDPQTRGTIEFAGTFRRDSASFRSTVNANFFKLKQTMTYTANVTWQRLGDRCDTQPVE